MSRGLGPEPSIVCCYFECACASRQVALSCLEVSKLQSNFISPRSSQALLVLVHCWSWHFSDIESDLFNAAILMDVQLASTKGLYGITSICSNPVLHRA